MKRSKVAFSFRCSSVLFAGAAGLAMNPISSADAQTQLPDQTNSNASQTGGAAADETGDIIVTAQKRETRLLDTALSISVLDQKSIERQAAVSGSDYLSKIPGVGYSEGGPAFSQVVIRGLAVAPETDGQTSGPITGVYFGEVPISGLGTAGSSADIKLVDMNRVEVLKGPQGTLYGAGAMGGVIRNIPNAPNLADASANVLVGYSSTARAGSDNTEVTAVINVPIIQDRLSVRMVGYRFSDSAYYRNIGTSSPRVAAMVQQYGATTNEGRSGANDYTGGRVTVLWKPSDRFDLTAGYLRQKLNQDGWAATDTSLGDGYDNARINVQQKIGRTPDQDIGPEFMKDDVEIIYGTANYYFSGVTATGTLSHLKEEADWARDQSPFFEYPIGAHLKFGGKATNGELRFASNWSGPFNAVVGYFYQDFTQAFDQTNSWAGSPTFDFRNDPRTRGFYASTYNTTRPSKQNALFGEARYEVIKGVTVTGGIRAFKLRKNLSTFLALNDAPVPAPQQTSIKANGVSGKAGIEVKPTSRTLVYGTWSQGFRLGDQVASDPAFVAAQTCGDLDHDGFYDGLPGVSTGNRRIDSDTVNSYEVGGKLRSENGRLQVQAAAFQTNWKKIPINILQCGNQLLLNAGDARIRGAELTLGYRFANGINIDASGAYTYGKLTSAVAGLGSFGAVGDRLPGTPKWSFNADAAYNFKLDDYEAFVGLNANYIGTFYETLNETGPTVNGYVNLGANAGVTINKVAVSIYGKNLGNSSKLTYISGAFTPNVSAANAYYGQRVRPRTMGVRIGYTF